MLRRVLVAVVMWYSAVPGVADARSTQWDSAVVDLSEQRVYILDPSGAVVRAWPASTGAAATPTPVGTFRVESKSRTTFARNNPSVTMAHMTRFNGGIGFHGIPREGGVALWTPLGRQPVSHGCVRLADQHAAALFHRLPIGAVVIVRP